MDKIIWIKRKPIDKTRFGRDAQSQATDKKYIGGSMTGMGTVLKGLSPEEEIIIMPKLLGIPATHNEFYLKSDEWFDKLRVPVGVEGKKLNISLMDDELSISEKNPPKVPQDYALWKFCLAYRFVGNSLAEMGGAKDAEFYLFSEAEYTKAQNNKAKLITKSIREYAKVSEDDVLMSAIIQVLKGKSIKEKKDYLPKVNPDKLDSISKQNLLSEVSIKYPDVFLEIAEDSELPKRAEIYDMIDKGVIETLGNKYLFDGEELGQTTDHIITFMKTAANAKKYQVMKARIESLKRVK